MVTSEIIQQVFSIRSAFGTGTAFTIVVNQKQYLITARHVLDGEGDDPVPDIVHIELLRDRTWHPLACRLVHTTTDPLDIAVLAPPCVLAHFPEVQLGTKGLTYGQEVWFLGFPFERHGDFGEINNGFPVPYVKRAIVSMINGLNQAMLVLDGINNSGFSGGPVVFKNAEGRFQIAAVISGFNSVRESVFKGTSDELANYTVDQNTGLIDSTPVEIVLPIIRAHSIGVPV